MIINVKEYVEKEKERLKEVVSQMKKKPKLAIIQVGDDYASNVYIRNKMKVCKEIGVRIELFKYDFLTYYEMLYLIEDLNKDDNYTGILVQKPLPSHLKDIDELIDPKKDVDGFHPYNQGLNLLGKGVVAPCTPQGIMDIIEWQGIDLKGKKVCIVGRSEIVGKPLIGLLLKQNATVVVCHSYTQNLTNEMITSDVVIVAVGKPLFLNTTDFLSPNSLVIDVGINRIDGKIVGDCNTEELKDWVDITPVPGGVGLTTTLNVVKNLIKLKEEQNV